MLITRFLSEEGVAEILDFMPVEEAGHAHDLVRQVRMVRGEISLRTSSATRASTTAGPRTRPAPGGMVFFTSDGIAPWSRFEAEGAMRVDDGKASAEFKLGPVSGRSSSSRRPATTPEVQPRTSISTTPAPRPSTTGGPGSGGQYTGRWREMVNRSALVLSFSPAEPWSLVAAPTFGLPEEIGGVRNWDYRYTWIRDSAFTLFALIRLGYTRRPTRSWAGSRNAAGQLGAAAACRSCTASTGGATSRRSPWTISRATGARRRCASATPPTTRCSSTSTAS